MPTFNVTTAEIAAAFAVQFPGGFTSVSKPRDVDVDTFIVDNDHIVTLQYRQAAGKPITDDPQALSIGRMLVKKRVERDVVWTIYRGNKPESLQSALDPYDLAITKYEALLSGLAAQVVSASVAAPASRVQGYMGGGVPLFTDADLGQGAEPGGGGRAF